MELKPERFERQLAGETLRPVYLLAGTEPWWCRNSPTRCARRQRRKGYGEREVFEAERDFDWNDLRMGLAALSLFSPRRLFDLRLPSGRPARMAARRSAATASSRRRTRCC